MNKNLVNRISELKIEVESLPNELLSKRNYEIYIGASIDEDRAEVYNDLAKIRGQKDKVYRKILGFLSAHLEDDSVYFKQLAKITFRPKEGLFNTIHYKNNEAWRFDKDNLLKLLDILENEFTEKMSIPKNEKSQSIFASGLFWTIIPIIAGLSYFFGIYKAEYDKSEIEKELNQKKSEIILLNKEKEKLRDTIIFLNERLKKVKINKTSHKRR